MSNQLKNCGLTFLLDARYYFGCGHIASVIISFLSIWTASIVFNDVESTDAKMGVFVRCYSKKIIGKFLFGIPFLLLNLVYRSLSIALLICFLEIWSGIIIFVLFFVNVLTALSIGDDFYRSCVYALWSLFVPVGYAR